MQMITLGGDAELELVDSLDPFAEGVVFSVRPPKKSWKNIGNLSGGEKVDHKHFCHACGHYPKSLLYLHVLACYHKPASSYDRHEITV